MGILSEQAAEEFVAARAFSPGLPGFVGIAVDLLVDPAWAPTGRRPLRHGFLDTRSSRVLVVSGPPSPGLEVALRRMGDDLGASGRIVDQHRLTVLSQAAAPEGPALDFATAGVRVGLEAGLDGGGPLGLPRRWELAHTLAPVLAAAFANSPLRDGRPSGWRSTRQALRRDQPVRPPAGEPRDAWAAYVLDAPGSSGRTPRQTIRAGGRVTTADLDRHMAGLRPAVAARGHLEIDAADRQPGNGWRLPAAVTSVLLDDPRAAEEATGATAHLADSPALWERAARDALTDPALAAAARDCFLAAYAALTRQGVSRELRDEVAEFTERYVYRGRCPADDILDTVAAHP
ncbi:ergothioneine biosynthesis glutamate--cysteine ligase EgtA [Actinoplanes sichuanensis]|uniref:glutamate--cysteine ligase n=1 Tax=Actinoplanes sichuanensis TaxID=512349 RepID=A0ABW3ZZV5_9ACTN|nr:glutamate-cysteine ligase family protein [Actinoplanes sichuanensis]BEL08046.1 ergothioneine biosynthesis glutamate--cysteine ligase EgtA [Actinoplanes sichuanensis]